jgi:Ca-activated chloride channel family protein
MYFSLMPRLAWLGPLLVLLGAGAFEPTSVTAAEPVEVRFAYGSEKDAWLQAVTKTFNERQEKTRGGTAIRIKLLPMGSGQCVDAAFAKDKNIHLLSPAAAVWMRIGDARAQAESGNKSATLVSGQTRSLVRSPVVIAMWKRMAQAIGWGEIDIGWNDLADLIEESNKEKKGWGIKGFPKWGAFKFAHTHPELSNSGLLGLMAMAYAGVDKSKNLTVKDIEHPAIKRLLVDIEGSIQYYGESTGFLANSMLARGPENISAVVMYENLVIESYDPKKKCPEPIVAIYPREGTFWSDHPAGVVKAPWVTAEHAEAAEKYLDFLLAAPQQQLAVKYGFRPGDAKLSPGTKIELGETFTQAYGVDPKQPKRVLEAPNRDVVEAILKLWREQKRRTRLVLAIDISFSMNRDMKLINARNAAAEMVEGLGENDTLTLLVFNDRVHTLLKDVPLKTGRKQIVDKIRNLKAKGSTALYDAVIESCRLVGGEDTAVQAIILLSDGVDVSSKSDKQKMMALLDGKGSSVPLIFTVAYGRPDDTDDPPDRPLLREIAKKSRAKFYDATPQNIRKAIQDINAFFGSKVKE